MERRGDRRGDTSDEDLVCEEDYMGRHGSQCYITCILLVDGGVGGWGGEYTVGR